MWLNIRIMEPQHPQYRPQPHQPSAPVPTNAGPASTYSEPQPQHDYSFIMEPANPFPKKSLLGPSGSSSQIAKIAVGAGVLFALLIFFVLIKTATGGNSGGLDMPSMLSVLQDQSELSHLTSPNTATPLPPGLAATTVDSRITVQLTINDAQGKLLSYLKTNHKKVNSKQIALKISATTDKQLTSAGANGIYDQTYQTVMTNQLNVYKQDLKTAYAKNTGAKGRTLLNNEYKGAQLLETQLSSPSS
jgi:hypothetical protein